MMIAAASQRKKSTTRNVRILPRSRDFH